MSKPQTAARVRARRLVLFIHVFILISLVAFGLLYADDAAEFQPDVLISLLCVSLLGLVIWFFVSWYLLTRRSFDPYLLFLTSAILFNGGQALLEVFQLNQTGFLDNEFPDTITLEALYLVALGLASLHFGAILSGLAQPVTLPDASEQPVPALLRQKVYSVGRILLGISILPAVMVLKQAIGVVLAGGYFALYQQEVVTGVGSSVSILADFIFPGAFFVIAGGHKKLRMRWLAMMAILLYSGARFFLGKRGAAIMPLLALLWLWNSVVRPVPKVLLLSFTVVMIGVVFPLVAAVREDIGADRFSIEFLLNSLNAINNPAVASISEMGGSMKTVAWTMQLTPNTRPFAWGMTYLTGILILIPNVFSEGRHPALTLSGYDIPDYWLAWEIEPEFAERGGSFGFSFIAEAYLNFGWGAPVFLGLLGLLYGGLVCWAVRALDPAKMALIATFVSFFLFYARGASEMIFRPLIWYSLFPYLWVRFLSASRLNSYKNAKGS